MRLLVILLFVALINACAPSRYVKPLAKNQKALAFSFGGPLIRFSGAPIPIPFSSLGYAQGLNENITAYGNLHSTSALFGNAQADLGATIQLYKNQERFGITTSPAIQTAYNLRNRTGFRLWPTLDLNAYFHPKNKLSYLYLGLNSWFELSATRAHNQPQPKRALPNMHLGYNLVNNKWQHQFELKYLGIGIPNQPGVVDYIGISRRGSLGIYYSLIRKF